MNEYNRKSSIIISAGNSDDGMTARGVLRRAKGVSQRLIRKIAHGEGEGAGALYINGHPARFRDRVKAGDEIRLVFPDEESWIEPEDIPLDVLYEDDDILVINKQPGIVVHPTKGHRSGTIAGAIVHHMQQRGESYKPRFISRLDMDTSGVLLIGKNSHAQDSLAKQGMTGGVGKYYTAVLEGRLEDDLPASGIIDLPIGLAKPGEPMRAVIPVEEGGYPSQTEYEIINAAGTGSSRDLLGSLLNKSSGSSRPPAATEEGSCGSHRNPSGLSQRLDNPTRDSRLLADQTIWDIPCVLPADDDCEPQENQTQGTSPFCPEEFRCEPQENQTQGTSHIVCTVVRARLLTGRTHQIRVHFAYYGHPVISDHLYGHPTELIGRQALHAEEITFAHPVTGEAMRIAASLPEDIALLF